MGGIGRSPGATVISQPSLCVPADLFTPLLGGGRGTLQGQIPLHRKLLCDCGVSCHVAWPQSITALAHLRAAVLYMVDVSEQCGYTITQQVGGLGPRNSCAGWCESSFPTVSLH